MQARVLSLPHLPQIFLSIQAYTVIPIVSFTPPFNLSHLHPLHLSTLSHHSTSFPNISGQHTSYPTLHLIPYTLYPISPIPLSPYPLSPYPLTPYPLSLIPYPPTPWPPSPLALIPFPLPLTIPT